MKDNQRIAEHLHYLHLVEDLHVSIREIYWMEENEPDMLQTWEVYLNARNSRNKKERDAWIKKLKKR